MRARICVYECGYRGFLAETQRIASDFTRHTYRGHIRAIFRQLHLNLFSTISTHFVAAQSAGAIPIYISMILLDVAFNKTRT